MVYRLDMYCLTYSDTDADALYDEMYHGSYAQRIIGAGHRYASPKSSSKALTKGFGSNTPEYRQIKRTILAARRWADVKEVTGWAGIILGDSMPSIWFERRTTDTRWTIIRGVLAQYSENVVSSAMKQMVNALGHRAPVGLLKGSSDKEFLSWFDGTATSHAQFICPGGMTAVSWIAGRIAQLWQSGRRDVIPNENGCFMELRAQVPTLDWPTAGIVAVDCIGEHFAWNTPAGCDGPLFIAPIERVILAVVPGLQFSP